MIHFHAQDTKYNESREENWVASDIADCSRAEFSHCGDSLTFVIKASNPEPLKDKKMNNMRTERKNLELISVCKEPNMASKRMKRH